MTEASYTAWDDKQYVWPPPDGWYQAGDGKWWPEGYGPPPQEVAASPVGDAVHSAAPIETDLANQADSEHYVDETFAGAASLGGLGSRHEESFGTSDDAGSISDVDGFPTSEVEASSGGFGSDSNDDSKEIPVPGLGDFRTPDGGDLPVPGLGNFRTSELGEVSATSLGDLPAPDLGDSSAPDLGDLPAPDLGDLPAPDLGDLSPPDLGDLPAPDLGDLPAPDLGDLSPPDLGDLPAPDLGDLSPQKLGDLPSPSLGALPAPNLGDLPAPTSSVPDIGDVVPGFNDAAPGLDDVTSDVGAGFREAAPSMGDRAGSAIPGELPTLDDVPGLGDEDSSIPSIRDLASPDLDLTDIKTSDGGYDADATQVIPSDASDQFGGSAPPAPGLSAPGFDGAPAPSIGAPTAESIAGDDRFGAVDATVFDPSTPDAPGFDGPPVGDQALGTPTIDAPNAAGLDFNAPNIEGASFAVHNVDAPNLDGRPVETPSFEGGGFDAPTGLPDTGLALPHEMPQAGAQPPQFAQQAPPQGQPPEQGFGQQGGNGVGFQPEELLTAKPKGGRSKKLLLVLLGVLLLAAIGAALFYFFGRDNGSEGESAVVATGPGSVNDPHPRATGVEIFYPDDGTDQRWVIEVVDPVRDATQEIIDGGSTGPEEGEVFAAARVRVSNKSGVDGASLSDLRFNAVNALGELIIREDSGCSFSIEDLDYTASVNVGSDVEGDVCWSIPAVELDGLKLGLESGKVGGRVHIALQ